MRQSQKMSRHQVVRERRTKLICGGSHDDNVNVDDT
jgi:hypothetical protein